MFNALKAYNYDMIKTNSFGLYLLKKTFNASMALAAMQPVMTFIALDFDDGLWLCSVRRPLSAAGWRVKTVDAPGGSGHSCASLGFRTSR